MFLVKINADELTHIYYQNSPAVGLAAFLAEKLGIDQMDAQSWLNVGAMPSIYLFDLAEVLELTPHQVDLIMGCKIKRDSE